MVFYLHLLYLARVGKTHLEESLLQKLPIGWGLPWGRHSHSSEWVTGFLTKECVNSRSGMEDKKNTFFKSQPSVKGFCRRQLGYRLLLWVKRSRCQRQRLCWHIYTAYLKTPSRFFTWKPPLDGLACWSCLDILWKRKLPASLGLDILWKGENANVSVGTTSLTLWLILL